MKFCSVKKPMAFVLTCALAAQLMVMPSFAATGVETVVDSTSPYSGETLVAINTNYTVGRISSSTYWSYYLSNAQSTGTISFSDDLSLPDASLELPLDGSVDGSDFFDDGSYDSGPVIMGYDENGCGLLDPNSFLPNLTDEGLEPMDLTSENAGIATMSTVETTSLYAYTTSSTSYTYATFELLYEGDYCKIWKLQGGDERFALTVEQAQAMANQYDTELYPQVINYFGDPLDLDKVCNNNGKTDFYCYDLDGDADTNTGAYAAGYFWSYNVTANNKDGVHIDSARGMGYDYADPDSFELDYTLRLGTLVHELQHLVCYGILGSTDDYPTFLNEAFSESAPHLIIGPEACTSRIEYFNTFDTLNSYTSYLYKGRVSLLLWNSYYYTIPNYSYSYLFGQYIRSQSDEYIYKDYLNAVKSVDSGYGEVDYIVYLSDMLGFESAVDMITSFYVALANPTGSGVYSFNNLDFAITPQVPVVTGSQSLITGGVVYYDQTGDFVPSDAGSSIAFYSVSQDLEVEKVTLTVDETAKTTYQLDEELDVTGLWLDVDYSNGASQTIAVTADMVTGFDSSTANEALTLTVCYGNFDNTFTVEVEGEELVYVPASEFYIQSGADGNNEYVSGYVLILAFTNDETVAFDYDGMAMYDVSANGYKADDGAYYAYAFALVVADDADEDAVSLVDRSSSHTVLSCTENVNNSATTDLRDAVAVMAVYQSTETYFEQYMRIVLQCDVNADGVVNVGDCAEVFRGYLT